ncbi:MAG TPA: hypothetical protein HA261_07585 [Methanosarcina sp.]|nr:hypothetical protein [Methanosarcina sp.]
MKIPNDASVFAIAGGPQKPFNICGAMTLKNVFTVFGIIVYFSMKRRFMETFEFFNKKVVDYT